MPVLVKHCHYIMQGKRIVGLRLLVVSNFLQENAAKSIDRVWLKPYKISSKLFLFSKVPPEKHV